MGQRSQLYIRYKNKKNLVAMHLQWNYGFYMINRTYQLLDFIGKNAKADYSNFREEHFDIANSDTRREDIDMLQNLIQMNTTIGSFVKGIDVVKEDYEWGIGKEDFKETFKMNPNFQDNNNGILVIDIQENREVKYGLSGGYEEVGNEDFKMISAKEYFRLSEKDYEDKYKLKNKDEELYNEVMKQIDYIDNNFTLLTDDEYKEIFDTEYKWEDCIKPKDLEELSKKESV